MLAPAEDSIPKWDLREGTEPLWIAGDWIVLVPTNAPPIPEHCADTECQYQTFKPVCGEPYHHLIGSPNEMEWKAIPAWLLENDFLSNVQFLPRNRKTGAKLSLNLAPGLFCVKNVCWRFLLKHGSSFPATEEELKAWAMEENGTDKYQDSP